MNYFAFTTASRGSFWWGTQGCADVLPHAVIGYALSWWKGSGISGALYLLISSGLFCYTSCGSTHGLTMVVHIVCEHTAYLLTYRYLRLWDFSLIHLSSLMRFHLALLTSLFVLPSYRSYLITGSVLAFTVVLLLFPTFLVYISVFRFISSFFFVFDTLFLFVYSLFTFFRSMGFWSSGLACTLSGSLLGRAVCLPEWWA